MKKFAAIMVLVFLAGCTSSTPQGKCVGLNGQEDPTLEYEYSAWNIGVGVLFCSLIIPPIIVALDELKCPVSRKAMPPVPAQAH